jgi:anionic cell wall polymer biosynthesis LytR-Cps2A-Psr (LCP) family protein
VQRITGRPVKYVARVDYEAVAAFANIIGGIMVDVDADAARAIETGTGPQTLTGKHTTKFLNPRLPGGEKMAIRRQKMVMRAFLKNAKEGGIGTYTTILMHMFKILPTNMTIKEGIQILNTYVKQDNWNIHNISLPATEYVVGPMVLLKPKYDRIQQFYN